VRSSAPAVPASFVAPRARAPLPRKHPGGIQSPVAVLSPLPLAHPASPKRRISSPLALWHLLSLDAPTVAVLWTWFLAASVHISLPLISTAAMAIAVWMLYAADRLLDARLLDARPLHTGDLLHRHRFHHRHRSLFLLGILAASVALALLIPRLHPHAIRLDLILGALLAGYFILVHATGSAHRLPNEIAVGLFFSAAVFIPTVARAPQLRFNLLPVAALFALLCSLNCLFIYHWEHPALHLATSTPHPVTRLAIRHIARIAALSLACDLLAAALSLHQLHPSPWTPPTACAISTAILLLLHRYRLHLSPLDLRAAADLALLTPLLLLNPLLPHPALSL